jgi:hypothetical protein
MIDGELEAGLVEPGWMSARGPLLQQLYRYWRSKSQGGRLPRRSDIDPTEIPRLLAYMLIVEVVTDARRYVYRLVGTQEVEMRGRDPTGLSVGEGYFGPSAENALAHYERTVKTRAPVYDDQPYVSSNGRRVSDETLFLPLSEDGERIDRILVIAASKPYQRPRP